MTAGPYTPTIRGYTEATSLEDTDAFVLDRIGVGTMYIEGLNLLAGILSAVSTSCLTYVFDGGGSELAADSQGDLEIPFACTIDRATLLADQDGDIEIDIWLAAYAGYPPTIADTITAAALPTITSNDHSQDTTLTGWTTAIPAGATLRFNINSATDITRVTISLKVTKT